MQIKDSINHTHFWQLHALFALAVATMTCLAARFQIQAFLVGQTLSRVFLVLFVGAHLLCLSSQRQADSPLANAMDVKRTYEGGSQESGSVWFETTIECHVALDVHAMVQK